MSIDSISLDPLVTSLDRLGDGRDRAVVPFSRSYWVVPGRLLAGYFPGHPTEELMGAQCGGLVGAGIRKVISLMEAEEVNGFGEEFPDYAPYLFAGTARARFERHPIVDMSVPSVDAMRLTLDAIDASIAGGEPVYVHCWGGRGRTGTVVGCWLMRHGHADPDSVLELIGRLRERVPDAHKASPETTRQCAYVRDWWETPAP